MENPSGEEQRSTSSVPFIRQSSGGLFFRLPEIKWIARVFAAAAVSVFCFRSGFLAFFFLLPLGLAAFGGGAKTAWAAGILASALNLIAALWLYAYQDVDLVILRWTVLYYTLMTGAFTWINAPLGKYWILAASPWRMAAAAALCTVVIAPLLLAASSALRFLPGGRMAALENAAGMTADEFFETLVYAGLRGGILLSCMVFWWINRQLAAGIIRISKRFEGVSVPGVPLGMLPGFHVPFVFVWILSLSLGIIIAGKTVHLDVVEIGGWNILCFSAMLFFVQGGAVAFHYLAKAPPALRFLINMGIIMLLFIPGGGVILPGLFLVLVLVGIAENWVPFRAPREEK